jgi:hypothetical protein
MIDYLIDILEHSVNKNGEIKLTNKHLLNILKMVKNQQNQDSEEGLLPPIPPEWD